MRSCLGLMASALLLHVPAPAFAALPEAQYIDAIMSELTACLDANDMNVPFTTMTACEAVHQNIERLQTEQVLGPGETRDLTWYARGSIQIHLAGAYLGIDNARSARACNAAELSLQYFGNVEPTFPYPDELATSLAGAYDPVRLCRVDFGRPWWGLDIP